MSFATSRLAGFRAIYFVFIRRRRRGPSASTLPRLRDLRARDSRTSRVLLLPASSRLASTPPAQARDGGRIRLPRARFAAARSLAADGRRRRRVLRLLLAPGRPGHGDVLVKPSSKYQGRGLFAARDFAEGRARPVRAPVGGHPAGERPRETPRCARSASGTRRIYRAPDRGPTASRLAQRGVRGRGGAPRARGAPAGRADLAQLARIFLCPSASRVPRGIRPEPVLLRRVRVERVVQTRETPLRRAVRRRAGFSRRAFVNHAKRRTTSSCSPRGSPRNSARRGEQSNESTHRRRFGNPGVRNPHSSEIEPASTDDGVDRCLVDAWRPYAMAHKGVWWETVAKPADVAAGKRRG